MVLQPVRCSNKKLCKNRIILKLSKGSTAEIQCPRCKRYYTITVN